jgi:hypothetical protein
MSDAPATEASKRFRSPPYPAIPLSKAIERAKELYNKALHHPVKVTVLAEAWDYGVKSSGLWATAAALLQFGLLTDEGSGNKRKFALTDAAIRIVRDPDPLSAKRLDAIKKAAIAPRIFRELWGSYGESHGSLSDMVLKTHLTVDRRDHGLASYSDAAADDVIRSFRETIAFAKLGESDILPGGSAEMDWADNGATILPDAVDVPPGLPEGPKGGQVKLMAGERVVFTEENSPANYLKLVASGDVDGTMLEALEDYVKRQKKRLGIDPRRAQTDEAAARAARGRKDEAAN